MNKFQNAMAEFYYGLHMMDGVCEYREKTVNDGKPYRVFLNEATTKKMDPTFKGRPVFVNHIEENVDEMDPQVVREEADGVVVRSFYNQADGKHWVEFCVWTDQGRQAIKNGWKLSNAYFGKEFASGGEWNGVSFLKEIKDAEYEHLALVKNPRYQESVVYTTDQFKAYNEKKDSELKRFTNSKGANKVFNFFKKEKMENSQDLESTMVLLPLSKKEMSVSDALKAADKFENMHGYACNEHLVKMEDESEMSVSDMSKEFQNMKKANAEREAKELEEKEKAKNESDNGMDGKDDGKNGKAKNSDDDGEFFEKLANADKVAVGRMEPRSPELSEDKINRGVTRYGSK